MNNKKNSPRMVWALCAAVLCLCPPALAKIDPAGPGGVGSSAGISYVLAASTGRGDDMDLRFTLQRREPSIPPTPGRRDDDRLRALRLAAWQAERARMMEAMRAVEAAQARPSDPLLGARGDEAWADAAATPAGDHVAQDVALAGASNAFTSAEPVRRRVAFDVTALDVVDTRVASLSAVPEPSAGELTIAGLVLMGANGVRRRRAARRR